MFGWRPRTGVLALAGTLALVGGLAGCATDIRPQDHTIEPTPVRLGSFDSYVLQPLAVHYTAGDRGDQAAVVQIETELRGCLRGVLRALREEPEAAGAIGRHLVVEPIVVDLKKVSAAERRWAGPLAGSSAVLLQLRLADAGSGETLAAPMFHARGDAWRGSFAPFAASDEAMLSDVVNEACRYARDNL